MRVLITGVAGFAGRHLAALLHERGDEVLGTVRPGSGERPLPHWIATHTCELSDPAAVAALVGETRPEAVFHLAADSSPRASLARPVESLVNNTASTAAVIEATAALAAPPRVLVVGSAEVYGPGTGAPLIETAPMLPASPYALSKQFGAELVRYAARRGLPVIEARPFNHLGPGQGRGFVGPDFAAQVADIAAGRAEPVLRTGNLGARKDFTDVRDIVRGYLLLAEGGTPGEAYHLCSGRATPVQEILDTLLELAGVAVTLETDPALVGGGPPPVVIGSYEKARAAVGWEPAIPLRQTLADLLAEWAARA